MTNARIDVISVARAHGWVVTPLEHGKVSFSSSTGRTRLTVKFDQTGRVRRVVVRRPLPPINGGGMETFEITNHRQASVLGVLRGEKAPEPISVKESIGDDLTELELESLADEAEVGYDPASIKPTGRVTS